MLNFQPSEKIIFEVRRHWLAFLRDIFVYVVLGALPFFLSYALGALNLTLAELGLIDLYWFLLVAWWLILWCFFSIAWTNYYLDVLVLTSERLIDIEQRGIFSRDTAEMRLENIQDVRVEIHGFLETLLNFGDLHIQTAATNREFVIRAIPDPSKIKDVILTEYDLRKKTKNL